MSNYFNRAGNRNFNQLFEPDSSGPTIPGYYDNNGNLLRYASINNGSKIANLEYYHPDGPDITNYWAGAGTVSYVHPQGNVGVTWLRGYTFSHTWETRVYGREELRIRSNGNWDLRQYGDNFGTNTAIDKGVRVYNYPNGREMESGKWLANPVTGGGAGYTLVTTLTSSSVGRINYNVIPPDSFIEETNSQLGNLNTMNGTVTNIGTHNLSSDVIISARLDQTPTGNNRPHADTNGGFSRFFRGVVRLSFRRNGNEVLAFNFRFGLQNRWADSNDGGGGGGGGGGGPGGPGCVAVDMWMDTKRQAHQINVGDWVDGSAYNPDSMVPRQVRANQVLPQHCYRISTVSGIAIIASDTTPMTMRDGSLAYFGPELLGQDVFVNDRGELRWEKVDHVFDMGIQDVVLFNVDDQSYFAGEQGDRRIATHNMSDQKVIQ